MIAKKSVNKVVSIEKAIQTHVWNGCHLSIGGFTVSRNPMAAVHEIIRQGVKNLHVYAHSNGQGLDELIGANCVSRLEIAYSGNGRFAPTCFCFKRHVIENKILVEDYTNFQMALRFLAGSMGVPFLPTYSSLGTDIIKKWGFDPELRKNNDRLINKKLVVMENPFSLAAHPAKVVLVPAIQPDITIIHAQKADTTGLTRIEGLTFSDVEQAKAAKNVIVTCDELLDPNILNDDPAANQLPSFCVDTIVHIPYGAYPTSCYGRYDYDAQFLDWYRETAAEQRLFDEYVNRYILEYKNHSGFLKKACGKRLDQIKADPETGYSDRIKRK
jgi:glutaconate CoA-transferase, subunit A